MKTSLKPDYGNWVPKKLLVIAVAVALVVAALLIASVCFAWGWLWTTVIALLLCFIVALLAYMTLSYRAFSHHGGGFMEKVHRYVAGMRALPTVVLSFTAMPIVWTLPTRPSMP